MKHIILASVFAFGAAAFAQEAQEPKQDAPVAEKKKEEPRKDAKGHKAGKRHGAEKKEGM